MKCELTQTSLLRAYESDFTGHMSPFGVLTRMQEISEDHAAVLGCARKDMIDTCGIAWILVHLHYEMAVYPKTAQEMVITTFPGEIERVMFPRYYTFCDPQGRQFGCASTHWVIFDIPNRKLLRPQALPHPFEPDPDRIPPCPAPLRLRMPDNMEKIVTYRVRYSDCDMNIHMNNARYASLLCDLFPPQRFERQRISELDITFSKEASVGEDMDVFATDMTQDEIYLCGTHKEEQLFSARIRWA